MFTGIVRHVGELIGTRETPGGRRLTLDLGPLREGLAAGDSVAVNGACLTAAALAESSGEFDVVAETLRRTTLGGLRRGAKVNLERALRLSDGLDGHIVQGHVDGMATVSRVDRSGGQWGVSFGCEPALTAQMVAKGSIALDGISLTLVDVAEGTFSVSLIPTTLDETTFADLTAGRAVNVEVDLVGKYVRRFLQGLAEPPGGGVTLEKLRRAGFA